MNAYPFPVPFYAFVPTVQVTGESLYLKTSFFQNILTLCSHRRVIHFTNSKNRVVVRVMKWWQWQRPVKIKFSKIDYIDLTYPRMSEHQEDHPELHYNLFLITRDPFAKIVLCRFESIISDSPILRKAAESCADLIAKHTGLRFGFKPKEFPSAQFNDRYICKTCGHRLHPDSEFILCRYCGGKEIEIVAESAGLRTQAKI